MAAQQPARTSPELRARLHSARANVGITPRPGALPHGRDFNLGSLSFLAECAPAYVFALHWIRCLRFNRCPRHLFF